MKHTFFYLIIIMGMCCTSCNDSEKSEKTINIFTYNRQDYLDGIYDYNLPRKGTPVENADVSLYTDELDYRLEENPVFTGKTDNNGQIRVPADQDYFAVVKKGRLNTYRLDRQRSLKILAVSSGANWALTSTATQLTLKVFHQGEPVSNARVYLYVSEEDYNNNLIYQETEDKKTLADRFPDLLYELYTYHLNAYTTLEGEAVFQFLEPREYWFRVKYTTNDGETLTNKSKIKLDGSLPDDPNTNTILQVGLEKE